jgi:hypothetical protein
VKPGNSTSTWRTYLKTCKQALLADPKVRHSRNDFALIGEITQQFILEARKQTRYPNRGLFDMAVFQVSREFG